jgi:hypothetical protein
MFAVPNFPHFPIFLRLFYRFFYKDILLLHPDTAHSGGPNRSYEIRKMVYFRLKIKCENDLPPSQRKNKIKKGPEIVPFINLNNGNDNCTDNKNDENCLIDKLTITPRTEKCEKKDTDYYPIFEDWSSVILAHKEDMWADLMGVKTLR